jgi:DNA polymerase III alpha subunit
VLILQEQVMQIAMIAGFTAGEADRLAPPMAPSAQRAYQ